MELSMFLRLLRRMSPKAKIDVIEKLTAMVIGEENETDCKEVEISSILVVVLTELSKDEEWIVRYYVAENPKTPVPILMELSTDKSSEVRSKVADNPNTPVSVLTELSL